MKTASYHIFKYSLLLVFLQSLFAWFLWGQFVGIFILCVLATFFFALTIGRSIYSVNKSNLLSIIFIVIIELYVIRDQNENALIAALLRIIIISIVLLLNNKLKIDLFRFLTKSFAVILAISLTAWIFFIIGISLPYFQTDFNEEQYIFDNYYFFLYNHIDKILPIPRFSSIFLEPGQLGMMTSFFLCANRFELKRKEVLVIFIATIFTFSLAAYVLLLISASVYLIIYSKKPIRNFILWGLFLVFFYSFFSTYKNGDNVINNFIFERLETDQSKLEENRFSQDMDIYFDRFIYSTDLILGIGEISYQKLFLGSNAGYKVFIVVNGVIGTLVIFLFYLTVVIGRPTKMAWTLFLVYILCFLQAAYPLWECELLLFITAIPSFNLITNSNEKIKKHKINLISSRKF